ncbi:MAG: EscU/YscU/HrcU family type III secretion system export apparatus switch protein [Deltaproteobacteria bacterium]|nr:EscU/YscU/HrcU family type III secretion system export apparatus switch protein [Deltaproteobacteria bacterium]
MSLFKKQGQAIALRYMPQNDAAPIVTVSESQDKAQTVKQLARRYGVPIIKNEKLTNKLNSIKVDSSIPADLYKDVAIIFASLQRQK